MVRVTRYAHPLRKDPWDRWPWMEDRTIATRTFNALRDRALLAEKSS
jgi:hypothetical protein